MRDAWSTIERAHAAQGLDPKLRPGASEAQIADAEGALGVAFPDDLRASMRIHDGQEDEHGVWLWPHAQRLGSLASIVDCWQRDRANFDADDTAGLFAYLDRTGRVHQQHQHPQHIPIVGDGDWMYDRLMLDYVPAGDGVIGQVIARVDIDVVYLSRSFGELVTKTAAGLVDGTITFETGLDVPESVHHGKRGRRIQATEYFGGKVPAKQKPKKM
jgi:cell wall assembly regulator SMI1